MSPMNSTAMLATVTVELYIGWLIPWNPRMTPSTTTSTMTLANNRMNDGINGRKEAIGSGLFDWVGIFDTPFECHCSMEDSHMVML